MWPSTSSTRILWSSRFHTRIVPCSGVWLGHHHSFWCSQDIYLTGQPWTGHQHYWKSTKTQPFLPHWKQSSPTALPWCQRKTDKTANCQAGEIQNFSCSPHMHHTQLQHWTMNIWWSPTLICNSCQPNADRLVFEIATPIVWTILYPLSHMWSGDYWRGRDP